MVSWALAGRHGWDAVDVVGGWAYAAWAYASLRFAAALLLGLECCCCCLELAGGRAQERKDQRSDAWLAWVWAPLGSWHACAVMLTGKRECRARPEGEESPPRGRRQWQLGNVSSRMIDPHGARPRISLRFWFKNATLVSDWSPGPTRNGLL